MAINWAGSEKGALTGGASGFAFGGPAGAAVGAGLGGLTGLFSNPQDPSKEAMKYLEQIPDELKPYFMPYIQSGQAQIPNVTNQYQKLTTDPNAVWSDFGKGFQQSPGYQWQVDQGQKAIENAAAAGGYTGTNQHQQNAAELTQNLANQDFYNYMSHIMNLYGTGLQGEQGLETQGLEAGKEYGLSLGANKMSEALLKYLGTAEKNKSSNNMFSNLFSMF